MSCPGVASVASAGLALLRGRAWARGGRAGLARRVSKCHPWANSRACPLALARWFGRPCSRRERPRDDPRPPSACPALSRRASRPCPHLRGLGLWAQPAGGARPPLSPQPASAPGGPGGGSRPAPLSAAGAARSGASAWASRPVALARRCCEVCRPARGQVSPSAGVGVRSRQKFSGVLGAATEEARGGGPLRAGGPQSGSGRGPNGTGQRNPGFGECGQVQRHEPQRQRVVYPTVVWAGDLDPDCTLESPGALLKFRCPGRTPGQFHQPLHC